MSDIGPPHGVNPPLAPPPQEPPPRYPRVPPRRGGCLTAIMVTVGIILLLPGLCALIFVANVPGSSGMDPSLLAVVLLVLMLGAFGIFLIWKAIRDPRS